MANHVTLTLSRAELSRLADAVEYTLEHEGLPEHEDELGRLYKALNDQFAAAIEMPETA